MAPAKQSNKNDWALIGEHEPYFGVISSPEFRSGVINDDAVETFYASGRAEVENLMAWRRTYLQTLETAKTGLDIGSGLGRLTFAMAAHCQQVVGFDVSASMIEMARKRASGNAIANVTFTREFPDGPFDWINSFIVFQHIPPREGLPLLKKALACANPGCVLTFHVTVWRDPHLAQPSDLRHRVVDKIMRMASRRGRGSVDRLIRMYDYDLSQIIQVLTQFEFTEAHLRHTNHAGHHGVWILAQRKLN